MERRDSPIPIYVQLEIDEENLNIKNKLTIFVRQFWGTSD